MSKTDYEKLPLESALEETPQIHSLVNVYANDAAALEEYIKTFHEISSQLVASHNRLTSCYQELAKHLRNFSPKNYAPENEFGQEIKNDFKKFSEKVSEMSTFEHILATQIADGVVYPLSTYIGSDLQEVNSLHSYYKSGANEVDRAISRYSRCRRRDPAQDRHEAVEEVFNSRKHYHAIALKYYARLNRIRSGQEGAILQPILGLLTALRSHHQLGHDFLSSEDNESFLMAVSSRLHSVKEDISKETEDTDEMISSIMTQSQLVYFPQPPGELSRLPPDTTLISKSGYLNVYRKYMGVMSSWERLFVFIEGGNLMAAHKTDVAGTLLVELDNSTVAHAADTDDRLHVFSVLAAKRTITLQALNDRERDEWMLTIERMAKEGGYVKEDIKPDPPNSFLSGVSQFFTGKRSSSGLSTEGSSPSSPDGSVNPPAGGSPSRSLKEGVIPRDAPIVFHIPVIEEDEEIEENDGSKSVSKSAGEANGSSQKEFSVVFLGCMNVNVDAVESFLVGQSVVFEVMRRIVAARAIHDMGSIIDLSLSVSATHLSLRDQSSGVVRLVHSLKDVAFWAAHPDNQRLIGYIVRSPKDPEFSCYVFESDAGGREICSSLGAAARHAYAQILDKKTHQEKQKQEMRILLQNIALLPDKGGPPELSRDGTSVLLDAEPTSPGGSKPPGPQRSQKAQKKPESDV